MHTVGYGPEAPRDLLHSIFCDNLLGNGRVRWQNRIALRKSRHQHGTANQLCVNKRFLTKKIFFFIYESSIQGHATRPHSASGWRGVLCGHFPNSQGQLWDLGGMGRGAGGAAAGWVIFPKP